MHHPDVEVIVVADPAVVAADRIAAALAAALSTGDTASLAVSGGSTAPALLAALGAADLDWARVGVWQVDERVAPDGDPDRNATQLDGFPGRHHPMPVTATDLDAAAAEYAAELPPNFDVVHLGLGDDGHTASWPPGDPVVDATESVAVVGPFNDRMRMTLTPPVVNGAGLRIVLTHGADKADPLRRWLGADGDRADAELPITNVTAAPTVVVTDAAGAPWLLGGDDAS